MERIAREEELNYFRDIATSFIIVTENSGARGSALG
jgi:hypothetical protein